MTLDIILEASYIHRALIGGAMISIITSLLGVYLVLKNLSLIGDGLGHAAFGGIAGGMLLQINPFLTAIIVATIGAFGIDWLMKKARAFGDAAIAVVLSGGMALAILIIGYAGGFTQDLFGYLFGSIQTIPPIHIRIIGGVLFATLVYVYVFYSELMYMSFNQELAHLQGGRTYLAEQLFLILIALAVVVSIQAVGILLVTALIVIPPLTALQVSRSFRETLLVSVCTSCLSMITGILLAVIWNLPPSGIIVMTLLLLFGLSLTFQKSS